MTQRIVLIDGQRISIDDVTGYVGVEMSGSVSVGSVSLLNIAESIIDPATEDRQAAANAILATLDTRAHGTQVAVESSEMVVSSYYHQRTALTSADQTIALGATYRNIRVWLDSGASNCHIALDGGANTDDPLISDADAYNRHLDSDGVANIYIESLGSTGYINVEAW